MGFLSARASMLTNTIKDSAESKPSIPLQAYKPEAEPEKSRSATENRSISFDHADTSQGKDGGDSNKKGSLKEDDSFHYVAQFIADKASFTFESSIVSGFLHDAVLVCAHIPSNKVGSSILTH